MAGIGLAQGAAVETEAGRKLDAYMKRMEEWGFSGLLLAAKDGKVVLSAGYGLADRERKLPMTPETVVNLGSITKQFTGAAILKLEMQGKLRVEDPITKYFKDVPADKAGITLHQLLTHTAGFADALGDDLEPIGRDAFVKLALGSELSAAPGTGFEYSNVGFSLAGAVVELVSGQGYEDYLQENLFRPAGMTKTGYQRADWSADLVAHGYRGGKDRGTALERITMPDGPGWHMRANGGILSTPGDMLRWHLALEGDAVLSAETRRKLFTPHVPAGRPDSAYGYGWGISKTSRGTRRIAHNGGNGIFTADFHRYPDEGVVFFVAANTTEFPCIPLSPRIEKLLFGEEVELPPAVVPQDEAKLQSYAGTYRLESGGALAVSVQEGRLSVAGDAQDAFSVLAASGQEESQRAAERGARLAEALQASRKGDYKPLYELNGRPGPLAEFEAENKDMDHRMQQSSGAFQSLEVLGTAPSDMGAATYVRMHFEKGVQIVEYGWMGPFIGRVLVHDAVPGRRFLPQSATKFAAFDPRSGNTVRLRFEDGPVLVLQGPSGELRAKKQP